MKIYDFDTLHLGRVPYNGSEPKTCLGDGKYLYVVKEPRPKKVNLPKFRRDFSADFYYNCVSEYLGSHIFVLCGIETHETYLGYFTCVDGVRRICVACKDFTTDDKYVDENGTTLVRICSLAEYKHDFKRNGVDENPLINRADGDASLEEIERMFRESKYFKDKADEFINEFYDRFVVDALISNCDRHNGNTSFLAPVSDLPNVRNLFKMSPVYDCGASFISQATTERLEYVLNHENELNDRLYDFFGSKILETDSSTDKIRPGTYFNSLKNENLNKAILRMYPRIKEALPSMYEVIDDLESSGVIEPIRAKFYKVFIEGRFKMIIESVYLKLIKRNKEN